MANVATESKDFTEAKKRWLLPKMLSDGTMAIRDNPLAILPQFPGESVPDYDRRIEATTLTNVYGKTVDLMSAAPFVDPVQFDPDADERIVGDDATGGWANDVDRCGTDLATFGKKCMLDLLRYGKCHIYVDYPSIMVDNQAEKEALNIRPYFRRVSPWDLFAWDVQVEFGTEIVRELRWKERVIERNGWEEKTVEMIRRILPDHVELWKRAESSGEWVRTDNDEMGLQINGQPMARIPMVTVYANRQAPFTSLPPLENLAHLNAKHLRTDSELTRMIHLTCNPFLQGIGMSKTEVDGLVIGPKTVVAVPNPDGKLAWVEHSGSQIAVVQANMEGIMRSMEGMALDLVTKKVTGSITATEKAINTAEQTSELSEMVRNLETGINQAFQLALAWEGEPEPESMPIGTRINTDFGLVFRAESDINQLTALFTGGAISHETLLSEVQARGLLRDSLNVMDEVKKAKSEAEAMTPSFLPAPNPRPAPDPGQDPPNG